MRVSPQKARLVQDLIKGNSEEQTRNTTVFTKEGVGGRGGLSAG